MSNATSPGGRAALTVVRLGATAILTAALAVSYMHLVELAQAFGERTWRAYAIAATVDTLIVLAVYAGRAAKAIGVTDSGVVRWALNAGIAATVVGNVHHGLSSNLPNEVFADGLLRPNLDALDVAVALIGVVVALWAPLAAELAYRVLLWAQDQQQDAVATATAALQATPTAPGTVEPAPVREDRPDGDDDGLPGASLDADPHVVDLYLRRLDAGQPVSERGLAALATQELGREVTRHQARKAIAAVRSSHGCHRRPRLAAV